MSGAATATPAPITRADDPRYAASTASAPRLVLAERFDINPTTLNEAAGGKVESLQGGRYRVTAKGQHCGVVNRNNRIYPAESTWGRHTREDSPFMARVRSRRVIGQLEHPPDGKSSMPLGAVIITEVSRPNDKGEVFVTFETMSTPGGKIVADYIRDGAGFGMSSRGNGSVVRNREGVDEVQPDFEPVTFDMVLDESTPGAEVAARRLKEAYSALLESAGGDPKKAAELAAAQVEVAMERDRIAESRPAGESEFVLALPDGSGTYRAHKTSAGALDVWLTATSGERKVVAGVKGLSEATAAAMQHLRGVMSEKVAQALQGVKDPEAMRAWFETHLGAPAAPPTTKTNEQAEVDHALPYMGTMLVLCFDSASECEKAERALEASGFHCAATCEDELQVYTTIENGDQAIAQVQRILADKSLEMEVESVKAIARGRVVWEGKMSVNTKPEAAIIEMSRKKLRELVGGYVAELAGTVPGDMDGNPTSTPQEDDDEDGEYDFFDDDDEMEQHQAGGPAAFGHAGASGLGDVGRVGGKPLEKEEPTPVTAQAAEPKSPEAMVREIVREIMMKHTEQHQAGGPQAFGGGGAPGVGGAAAKDSEPLPPYLKKPNEEDGDAGDAFSAAEFMEWYEKFKKEDEAVRHYVEMLGKDEVAPPGWEPTVKAMKKHMERLREGEIENPWALAWWMKGQGYEPHKKDENADVGASGGGDPVALAISGNAISGYSGAAGVGPVGTQAGGEPLALDISGQGNPQHPAKVPAGEGTDSGYPDPPPSEAIREMVRKVMREMLGYPAEGDPQGAPGGYHGEIGDIGELVREMVKEYFLGSEPNPHGQYDPAYMESFAVALAQAVSKVQEAASGYGPPNTYDDPEDLDLDLDRQDAPAIDFTYAERRKRKEDEKRRSKKKDEVRTMLASELRAVLEARKKDDEKKKDEKRKKDEKSKKDESHTYFRTMPLLGPKGVAGTYRLWFDSKDQLTEVEAFDPTGKFIGRRPAADLTEKNKEILKLSFEDAKKNGRISEKRTPTATPAKVDEKAIELVFSRVMQILSEKRKKEDEKKTDEKRKKEDEKKREDEARKKKEDEKKKDEAALAAGDPGAKIRALESEVARLEKVVADRNELIEAMAEMQRSTAVEHRLGEMLVKHPELNRVRDRLLKCESVEGLEKEVGVLVGMINESRPIPTAPATPSPAATNGTANGTTSVSSSARTDGAPRAPVNEDASAAGFMGGLKDMSSTVDDTAGRTKAYRARQRSRRG